MDPKMSKEGAQGEKNLPLREEVSEVHACVRLFLLGRGSVLSPRAGSSVFACCASVRGIPSHTPGSFML